MTKTRNDPVTVAVDKSTYRVMRDGEIVGIMMKEQGEGWRAYDGAGVRTVSPVTYMSANDALRAYRYPVERRSPENDWNDDVTPEAVDQVRARAAVALEGVDLELIDGFAVREKRP